MEYLYEIFGGILIFLSSFVGEQLPPRWKKLSYVIFAILAQVFVLLGVKIRKDGLWRERTANDRVASLDQSLKSAGDQLTQTRNQLMDAQRPGAYFFRREQNTLELLKEGKFRAEAHHLGLEQELPADACVDIFFLADLKRILEQHGNRGYRAVQVEAGTIGGRIYLATYAQHLGATGLTFFDDDVITFFSPHARDKSAIFLLAIGKPLKRKPQ
jgi:nitroreductase